MDKPREAFEVIIIGGSYAGLSAAMSLGRSRRKVLLIDGGSPCNASTPYSHNFLTRDGIPPAELSAIARKELNNYPTLTCLNSMVKNVTGSNEMFSVTVDAGNIFSARKIILATGILDELPGIPGLQECWGISAIHCPYCHGYEFRDKPTAILGNGARAFHLAALVRNLTSSLVIYTNEKAVFSNDEYHTLTSNGIIIDETPVSRVNHHEGHIEEVILANGKQLSLAAMYVVAPFRQSSDIIKMLDCKMSESGHIIVDNMQQTTVKGIYACGDNASAMRSVASAVYTGSLAGAAINASMAHERMYEKL